MADSLVLEDGNLCSQAAQTPAAAVDAGGSSPSLPILLVVVGEPLSEKHKNALVKRIASGNVSSVVRHIPRAGYTTQPAKRRMNLWDECRLLAGNITLHYIRSYLKWPK